MRRALALLTLVAACGCAYYNGLYNARGLVKRAESATLDGRDSVAQAAWREAGLKADTVFHRYPRSKWADDALLLSGVAAAMTGDCAHGMQRLEQWQAHPSRDARAHAKASLARGACLVRRNEPARALDTLTPLMANRDEAIARLSAASAARAALALGRDEDAASFAKIAGFDVLDGELASGALASNKPELARRLIRQRAGAWHSLSAVRPALQTLAHLDPSVSDTIVALAQTSRASRVERARLLIDAGTWAEQAGDLDRARRHYERALRTTADTGVLSSVVTRLALADIRSAASLADAQAALQRARARKAEGGELARVDSALRLATRLAEGRDSTGASLFLAAEVARDVAGAPRLARILFLTVARARSGSSLAPKALLAAADLTPDSASAWRAHARTRYGDSPYVHLLDGRPAMQSALDSDDRLLRDTWLGATARTDSASVATEHRRP